MTGCTLCNYLGRADIEKRIASRQLSQRDAARIVGCDHASVSRHMSNHVTVKIAKAAEVIEQREGLNAVHALLEQLEEVRGILKRALARGDDRGDRTALKALEVGLKHIELDAKLTGKLGDGTPQVNFLLDARYMKIKEVLVRVLEPYPQLKEAMADALLDVTDDQS